ncbi:MAG: hypothetical protein IJP80_09185 [Bacteroidales bacterium]|nr:hypothetical protein [Bacteroidales bacterium]
MSLLLDFPWYFCLFCLLLGVIYALLLYVVGRRDTRSDFSPRLSLLLGLLRTLSVAAIAFLLLSPLLKRVANRKEKPLVIIAEDNSQSLRYCPDSAYYVTEFADALDHLAANLGDDFEVSRYTYGQSLQARHDDTSSFTHLFTDISQALADIDNTFFHRNVGALILTGDGIVTHGSNPLSIAPSLSYPIYTVAMGDTTVYRDAALAHVRCNRIAYVGNNFPIEVSVTALRLKGEHAKLTISCEGKVLESREVSFGDSHTTLTETFVVNAEHAGIRHYQLKLSPLDGEKTLLNNTRSVLVDVVDGHKNIAIVAAVPHPDIAALKAALESDRNYKVKTFLASDFDKKADDFDLIVFHQLPAKQPLVTPDISSILDNGIPALFVLGSLTDLARLNALHAGVEVYTRIDRTNEVAPLPSSNFSFFTLPDEVMKRLTTFPPLLSPFGDYKVGAGCQTLLFAKVGSVNSGLPLAAAGQSNGRKFAFISGEGLWRWRLSDWQQYSTHDDFDQLISKLVTFTAMRLDKDRLHIETKHLFAENEPVLVDAQLYDENFEPVNTPDVEFTVEHLNDAGSSDGKSSYQFNRRGDGYALNIGSLASGSYRYSANTSFNGKQLSATGLFAVEQVNVEAAATLADHSLLHTLSALTGAEMVPAHEVESLADKLNARDDLHTLIISETSYGDMLNMPLVFILIILLLGAEWVIRKYNGTL